MADQHTDPAGFQTGINAELFEKPLKDLAETIAQKGLSRGGGTHLSSRLCSLRFVCLDQAGRLHLQILVLCER